ncbi:MAG: PA14 domain-containing protein [Polyangia bacterium]
MSAREPEQRAADGPKRGSRFDVRAAEAAGNAAAARHLLGTWGVAAEDALVPLRRGWIAVDRAVEILAGGQGEDRDDGASVADSIRSLVRPPPGQLARLESAHADYRSGRPCEMSRRELRLLSRSLSRAAAALQAWSRTQVAPTGLDRPALRSRQLWAAAAIALLGVIAGLIVLSREMPDERDGLLGSYYGKGFDGEPDLERIDHGVDFHWKRGRPARGIRADHFNVRWRGCLLIDRDRPTYIYAGADDGMDVWIDGKKVISGMRGKTFQWKRSSRRIEPGVHRIRIDYLEKGGYARARLGWVTPNGYRGAVPARNLAPPGGSGRFDCPVALERRR